MTPKMFEILKQHELHIEIANEWRKSVVSTYLKQ